MTRSQAHVLLLAISISSIIAPSLTSAAELTREKIGLIDSYTGTIKHHINNAVQGQLIKQKGISLHSNDRLRSKRSSTASITLIDNSRIILTENSLIQFKGINQISHGEGKVLFDITKQGNLKGFRITLETAIIGVKGTQFLIDKSKNHLSVYMKKGTISIQSTKGQFRRLKEKTANEFETFKQENLSNFEAHKKTLETEFSEFISSFNLTAGQSITIDNNDVKDVIMPESVKKLFQLFDQ